MTHLARPALGLLLFAFTLLLPSAPAAAIQLTDLALNCAGAWLEAGVVLTGPSCQGQGLFLGACLTEWPVDTAPITRFALTLDGVLVALRQGR